MKGRLRRHGRPYDSGAFVDAEGRPGMVLSFFARAEEDVQTLLRRRYVLFLAPCEGDGAKTYEGSTGPSGKKNSGS